jgi:hypothetical protein
MSSNEESVYRINTDGTVDALRLKPGQQLGKFYVQALRCDYFTYVQEHRIVSNEVQTNYTLWLVGDEEGELKAYDTALNASNFNPTVSQVLGHDFFGPALLVCMHAVGDDGEERLADVGLIYRAIGSELPTPWTDDYIAKIRSQPLQTRAMELLELFD